VWNTQVGKLLAVQVASVSYYFLSFASRYSQHHLLAQLIPFKVKDQVPHPYKKKTDNFKVSHISFLKH
jgi:hypothetical protein